MLSSSGYSIPEYGEMIRDQGRMGPFAEALRRHVFPGAVVADLGAGTGIFSLLACQYGAARVYAIEPDAAIRVAREAAAANGFRDRITCIEGLSTDTTLPERVDLVVSDMRGALPLYEHHFAAIADARERFLKPGGTLIPARDTLRCAPVEAPELYVPVEEPWNRNPFGLDLSAGGRYATRVWSQRRIEGEQLLATPGDWAHIDYATVSTADVDGTVRSTIARAGTMHGFCVWFDAELSDGIGYSNAPGLPDLVYGHGFVPLERAVVVEAGDRVEVRLRANLVRSDYVYRWDTRVMDAEGAVKAEFRQSNVGKAPLSLADLRKRTEAFVPKLGERGEIDRAILEAMGKSESLATIARGIDARFPGRFASWRHALDHVADLSSKYAE